MKTDTQVKSDVLAALQWEPTVDARELSIDVNNGIVRLTGCVGSYVEKWDAGRATQRVSGVQGVESEIIVMLSDVNKRNDADIANSVVNVLQWMSYLPKNCVKVEVENAWITLSGEVEWEFQRQAVRGTVRFLIGIKGLIDHITVKRAVAAGSALMTKSNDMGARHTVLQQRAGSAAPNRLSTWKDAERILNETADESPESEIDFDIHPFFIAVREPAGGKVTDQLVA